MPVDCHGHEDVINLEEGKISSTPIDHKSSYDIDFNHMSSSDASNLRDLRSAFQYHCSSQEIARENLLKVLQTSVEDYQVFDTLFENFGYEIRQHMTTNHSVSHIYLMTNSVFCSNIFGSVLSCYVQILTV